VHLRAVLRRVALDVELLPRLRGPRAHHHNHEEQQQREDDAARGSGIDIRGLLPLDGRLGLEMVDLARGALALLRLPPMVPAQSPIRSRAAYAHSGSLDHHVCVFEPTDGFRPLSDYAFRINGGELQSYLESARRNGSDSTFGPRAVPYGVGKCADKSVSRRTEFEKSRGTHIAARNERQPQRPVRESSCQYSRTVNFRARASLPLLRDRGVRARTRGCECRGPSNSGRDGRAHHSAAG
jgi:hypothetical protein